MNRIFYRNANFFVMLTVAAGVFQSTLVLLHGPGVFSLESFAIWFLVVNAVTLAAGICMLKYFHYRKYRLALLTGTIAVLGSLCHATIIYIILVSGELQDYFMPTLLISMGTGMIYATSLIFSRAGERLWLKIAGVSALIIGVVVGAALLWGMKVPEVYLNGTLDKIFQRASLVGSLIPLLYIMNFLDELKSLKKEAVHTGAKGAQETPMTVVVALALFTTIVLGVLVATEAGTASYWQKRNAEKTQALINMSESRIFVGSTGDTLQYLLLKPSGYDSARQHSNDTIRYPLVVNLPYGGYEGAEVAQILSGDYHRKTYPSFLFVPYCPQGSGWGGIPGYPDIDTLVFEAIRALDQKFPIDTNRRYVTGISRGGYGSWHFITNRPEMFAAAIPVCGAGDPQLAPQIVDVAVWAFHGEKDKNVPVSGSREMIEGIKKAGGDPQYTEYQGQGHNIWYQVSTTPGLLEWLFNQKRK